MLLPLPRMRSAALAMAVAACLGAQESDMAERLFRSGERAYSGKAYAEALENWGQVLQQAPKSPFAAQALLRLARHQLEQERKPEAALPLLDRVKNEHMKTPFAADASLLRGRILAAQARKPQDLRDAQAEFNRVLELYLDHPAQQEARYQLGLALELQGQWGRALQNYTEVLRQDPGCDTARMAQLRAAEVLDILGDLPGCLRLLQGIRTQHPSSPEAREAEWRLALRVKQRIQKPALKAEGPWPAGKTKWLKSPTLLATGPDGAIFVYQDGKDQAFRLQGTEAVPVGALLANAKAMSIGADGSPALLTSKFGITRSGSEAPLPLASASTPSGLFHDCWNGFWVSDAKNPSISVVASDGSVKALPCPAANAMAPLPNGGAVVASDANRGLLFLDAAGQPRFNLPYGKDLPVAFKYVVALCTDPVGHVAAIVDGDFEGVVLWGPTGTVLRSATFASLGLKGRFKGITLDRQGGLILADRSNDQLIRLN